MCAEEWGEVLLLATVQEQDPFSYSVGPRLVKKMYTLTHACRESAAVHAPPLRNAYRIASAPSMLRKQYDSCSVPRQAVVCGGEQGANERLPHPSPDRPTKSALKGCARSSQSVYIFCPGV